MKNKILLFMPNYSGIYLMVIKNLEKMGFEVTFVDEKKFKYKSTKDKIYNFYRKTFLGDKEYKDNLRRLEIEKDIINDFNSETTFFDYVLIIHPSNYTIKAINHLKKISSKVLAYHWEGFSRFKVPEELIDAFDVFGVFDKRDFDAYKTQHKNIILTQSFFFDLIPSQKEKDIDLLYVGADLEKRHEHLKSIIKISPENLHNYFRLFSNKKIENKHILSDNKGISYEENLKLASKSKCQIDMKLKAHNGLSLRFFEALHFSQKIITDNKHAKEIDFYHPNNILIIDDWKKLTQESLVEFLDIPYSEIPENIKSKYSFEEWFQKISGWS